MSDDDEIDRKIEVLRKQLKGEGMENYVVVDPRSLLGRLASVLTDHEFHVILGLILDEANRIEMEATERYPEKGGGLN